jgi:hypothetical protein
MCRFCAILEFQYDSLAGNGLNARFAGMARRELGVDPIEGGVEQLRFIGWFIELDRVRGQECPRRMGCLSSGEGRMRPSRRDLSQD